MESHSPGHETEYVSVRLTLNLACYATCFRIGTTGDELPEACRVISSLTAGEGFRTRDLGHDDKQMDMNHDHFTRVWCPAVRKRPILLHEGSVARFSNIRFWKRGQGALERRGNLCRGQFSTSLSTTQQQMPRLLFGSASLGLELRHQRCQSNSPP